MMMHQIYLLGMMKKIFAGTEESYLNGSDSSGLPLEQLTLTLNMMLIKFHHQEQKLD